MAQKRCYFCNNHITELDYTQAGLLTKFLTGWAKIKPGNESRLCSSHQRRMKEAIKRSRFLAILPYVKR